jgi:hypothetical protein
MSVPCGEWSSGGRSAREDPPEKIHSVVSIHEDSPGRGGDRRGRSYGTRPRVWPAAVTAPGHCEQGVVSLRAKRSNPGRRGDAGLLRRSAPRNDAWGRCGGGECFLALLLMSCHCEQGEAIQAGGGHGTRSLRAKRSSGRRGDAGLLRRSAPRNDARRPVRWWGIASSLCSSQ